MIKLSRLTDYAVVILSEMVREPGLLMAASTLAGQTNLPEPTVAKILKLLAKQRLVTSVRGVSGGYRLERAAAELQVTDIITAMEGPIALTACVEGSEDCCSLEKNCSMRGRWNPVNAALHQALGTVTLADMMV